MIGEKNILVYVSRVKNHPQKWLNACLMKKKLCKTIYFEPKNNIRHKYTIVHLERMQTSTTQNEVLETRQSRRLRKMLKMGQVSIPFRTSQWVKNEGK